MTQVESVDFTGPLFGAVSPLPEDYTPKVLLSDEEYEAICVKRENGEKLSKADEFFGRDYVVAQFRGCTKKAYAENYLTTDAVLAELSEKRLADLFVGLKKCSCCWRHCHNTPVSHDSWEDRSQLDVATVEMVSDRNCHCYCRMAKRAIRRVFLAKCIELEA